MDHEDEVLMPESASENSVALVVGGVRGIGLAAGNTLRQLGRSAWASSGVRHRREMSVAEHDHDCHLWLVKTSYAAATLANGPSAG